MAVTVRTTTVCGFCQTGNHDRCSVGVKHQGRHDLYPSGIVWACNCTEAGCHPGRRKCSTCGNRTTEQINPETWECLDAQACQTVVETRRENNPFLAQLREIKENVTMAKVQNDKAKAEKAAATKEPTYCLVTGEPTKGGLFKPGMDARYVSERVTEVINGNFTAKVEKAQRDRMKKDGVSEKLVAKFEKSLALAKEKAEKREAAKAEKAAAKAS